MTHLGTQQSILRAPRKQTWNDNNDKYIEIGEIESLIIIKERFLLIQDSFILRNLKNGREGKKFWFYNCTLLKAAINNELEIKDNLLNALKCLSQKC